MAKTHCALKVVCEKCGKVVRYPYRRIQQVACSEQGHMYFRYPKLKRK